MLSLFIGSQRIAVGMISIVAILLVDSTAFGRGLSISPSKQSAATSPGSLMSIGLTATIDSPKGRAELQDINNSATWQWTYSNHVTSPDTVTLPGNKSYGNIDVKLNSAEELNTVVMVSLKIYDKNGKLIFSASGNTSTLTFDSIACHWYTGGRAVDMNNPFHVAIVKGDVVDLTLKVTPDTIHALAAIRVENTNQTDFVLSGQLPSLVISPTPTLYNNTQFGNTTTVDAKLISSSSILAKAKGIAEAADVKVYFRPRSPISVPMCFKYDGSPLNHDSGSFEGHLKSQFYDSAFSQDTAYEMQWKESGADNASSQIYSEVSTTSWKPNINNPGNTTGTCNYALYALDSWHTDRYINFMSKTYSTAFGAPTLHGSRVDYQPGNVQMWKYHNSINKPVTVTITRGSEIDLNVSHMQAITTNNLNVSSTTANNGISVDLGANVPILEGPAINASVGYSWSESTKNMISSEVGTQEQKSVSFTKKEPFGVSYQFVVDPGKTVVFETVATANYETIPADIWPDNWAMDTNNKLVPWTPGSGTVKKEGVASGPEESPTLKLWYNVDFSVNTKFN